MKSIYVTFDDHEHVKLLRRKKKYSWHDFILKANHKHANERKTK